MAVAAAALDEMGFSFHFFLYFGRPVFSSDGDYNKFCVCNAFLEVTVEIVYCM